MLEDQDLNPMGEEADGGEQEDEGLRLERDGSESEGEHSSSEDKGAGDAADAGRQKDDADRRFNSAMRAARLTAERETRGKVQREIDEKIAGMRIPNPYVKGSYFGSVKEMEQYSEALRRSEAEARAGKEGRSVEDVLQEDEDRAFVREMRREKKANAEIQKQKEQQDAFIAQDLKDFQERYPEVDIAKLDSNKAFRRFAGSRYGKEPLADLYRDFSELVGDAGAAALNKAQSKASRSSGAGSGGTAGGITGAQREALRQWNEEHPEMRMSEKEFMEQ